MALIDIEFGSLASSDTLNKNFKFLQDSISEFAQVIETNKASLESQVSTVNTNVNTKLDGLTETINLNSPAGTIMMTLRTSAPTGYLFCKGQAVSRTTYKDLFNAIGTVYGSGDGSTTFNLPDFRNRTPWGSSENNSFGYLSAGLPNITGSIGGCSDPDTWGAFYQYGHGVFGGQGAGAPRHSTYMDASRSSAIYGASSTVQPPAIKVNFIIKF